MQVKLYIENKSVDLDENMDIRLNKEFQDPESLIITDVNYSFEIELPVTLTNRKIFGFPDVAAVENKFDRVYDAQLYADEVLLLDGKFLINEIDGESYRGNLYVPAKKELSDVLGERTLKQLIPHYKYINNFSDIDKINCYVGGITGDDVELPPAEQRDNHVCFPYVLYNWPYNKPDVTTDRFYQSLKFEETTFTLNNIFPAFNVLSVLKDMFETEGYNLVGNVFDNVKLNGLYQTYYESPDLWKQNKMTPYYLSFDCSYRLCKYDQTTAQDVVSKSAEEFDDENFRFYADSPFLSNNSVFTNVNNKYNMMKDVYNDDYGGEQKVVVIPVSGWYQISTNGNIVLPDYNRSTQFDNITVTGYMSRDDNTSFEESSYEFQIKKGVPKENVQHYGYNFCLPTVPVEYQYNSEVANVVWFGVFNGPIASVVDMPTAIKVMNNENTRRYGKNTKTTIVKNYSGFDTSDFLLGARFGHQALYKGVSCRVEYREYPKNAMMALYDVAKTPQIINSVGVDDTDFELHSDFLVLHNNDLSINNTYGYKTAQAMVHEDGFANFEGYNILKARQAGDNIIYSWDTGANSAKTYPGQLNNSVNTTSSTTGNWNVSNCVWLEEGDTVYAEFLGAYNHTQDKCDSLESCPCSGRKHFWKRGCTNATLNFSFSIGLVSTDKDWKPTVEDPIKTGADLTTPRLTDMNQFLPNIKCNDYLNNFLNTFNCRLSMVDETTYSLDFLGKDDIFINTVSIDDYCHVKDATFKRINLPSSINYRFKVDTTEEGYVHGNNSPYQGQPQWLFNQPEHTGEFLLSNPNDTSGSEKKTESLWSYTWLKTIKASDDTEFPAPVIADASLFGESYSYETAQREAFKTDKTMRLFYIYNKEKVIDAATSIPEPNYLRIYGENTFRLLIADSCRWAYGMRNGHNYIGEWKSIFIDYDNRPFNTLNGRDTTLTDSFFNLSISTKQYECVVECILPNFIYWSIGKGSKVMFNGSLWDVKSIEGFDVYEKEPCELTLLSLNT